ncbi:RNA polymerase sigma factor [Paenibacillus apiarius]|uniref:RNA polymerase sigma factor n=1 Tax=Paenibacillus apiarius TaxID=46240 RepID=A0ABT4E228_9BACL|nr:RNA polymerase sigma factor [Paenibacillus apiarius]MCY9517964.1 RNA polymerase sigma factor [Paenibacillus apiarius]MCY9523565.1 RNA polymerase sigma factor [Paenibacillus apiarius]MCY9555422.1 RNA polymerase sigma factor [Paenibacillus apiarius]MCY9561496.1 RNA polymerase sigma factor [Paenibacillus apiarius]MCY9684273.1 RNA polymerase sigma factor [Paenibacillus apiarius]
MAFVKSDFLSSEDEVHAALIEALPSLRNYCLSLTGSKWEAEDLVQEACLKALPALRRTGVESVHPEAYLLRTAKHAWIDLIRKERSAKRLEEALELPPEAAAIDSRLELESALWIMLKHLSPLQRTVFLLRVAFGYTSADTATMLSTTEGAIKSALYRARTVLGDFGDSEVGLLPDPREQELLKAYLSAFRNGDAIRIVALGLNDIIEPVVCIGTLLERRARRSQGMAGNAVNSCLSMLAA